LLCVRCQLPYAWHKVAGTFAPFIDSTVEKWKAYLSMKILLISVLLLLQACANTSKKSVPVAAVDDQPDIGVDIPIWVSEPAAGCSPLSELCASAEGLNLEDADTKARKSLAGIFKTQITSDFSSQMYSLGKADPSTEEVVAKTLGELSEKIEEELKNVTIKKRFIRSGVYFSLASLDKTSFAQDLRRRIEELDAQILSLYQGKKRSSYAKLLGLYKLRSDLNSKFDFLMGKEIIDVVSIDQINQLKYSKSIQSKKISILVAQKENPEQVDSIKNYLASLLTSIGHQVISSSNISDQEFIQVKVETNNEYFNVEGFKKIRFSLILSHLNKSKEKLGVLNFSESAVGRDSKQAFEKIRKNMFQHIDNNLSDLNID
jgi:hypothetical protein